MSVVNFTRRHVINRGMKHRGSMAFSRMVPVFVSCLVAVLYLLGGDFRQASAANRCFKTRFVVSGSTVTDNATGLIWQAAVAPGTYTGEASWGYCQNLGATPGVWRVPSVPELISLVDYNVAVPGPLINSTVFPNTQAERFWTSTPYPGTEFISYVDFGSGVSGQQSKIDINSLYRVRCVR